MEPELFPGNESATGILFRPILHNQKYCFSKLIIIIVFLFQKL